MVNEVQDKMVNEVQNGPRLRRWPAVRSLGDASRDAGRGAASGR
jgi:hypothetical protein